MRIGIRTLIAGVVIFVVGAFVVPAAVILPVFLSEGDDRQFLVPGTEVVEVEKTGRYYLWNDFQTFFDGKSYNRSENIPDGVEVRITGVDGEELGFSSDTSISSSSGSSSRNSIGFVEVTRPMRVTVSVLGDFEERVFSFSEDGVLKMLGLVFAGFAASMLLALTGVGVVVWGIVKLVRNSGEGGGTKEGGFNHG